MDRLHQLMTFTHGLASDIRLKPTHISLSTRSKDIGQYIATRKMEYDEFERDAIGVQLSIDKNAKMSVLKKLKRNLSRANVHQIFFTFQGDSFRTYLSRRLLGYCDDYYSGRVAVPVNSISMMPMLCSDDHIFAKPNLVIVAPNKDFLPMAPNRARIGCTTCAFNFLMKAMNLDSSKCFSTTILFLINML
jgi:hypothetical protein